MMGMTTAGEGDRARVAGIIADQMKMSGATELFVYVARTAISDTRMASRAVFAVEYYEF